MLILQFFPKSTGQWLKELKRRQNECHQKASSYTQEASVKVYLQKKIIIIHIRIVNSIP
jgi:hypothetical protein